MKLKVMMMSEVLLMKRQIKIRIKMMMMMSLKRNRMRKKVKNVLVKTRMLMKKVKKNMMMMIIIALILPTLMMKEHNHTPTIMKYLKKERMLLIQRKKIPLILNIKKMILKSTSSHSISSNFGNQFLVNSPNAFLTGTIPENTDKEITSMMDIEIQQDVPLVQNKPLHEVKVFVIPETTQQPPSTPPASPRPATEDPVALVINFEVLKHEVSVKKEEYKDFIQETVVNEVKNQLSKILSKAVSNFATPVIQNTIKESLEQTPVVSAKSSSQPQSSYAIAESLTEFKLMKILMEKIKKSPKIPKKDWFKDYLKLEVLDPEWNTVKTVDDTPKQPWFNQMVQAMKPPLIFDELMSTPIDFLAFANHL
uniref:Uncharacterized protein n=1 Tax=Tanacetum cinerariifolium TaxID=118510 RepID=A0A699ICI0_TANCI|nr:hypothetical protein [Tanacetum cinerariifolium]